MTSQNKRISELTAASLVADTDLIEIVQSDPITGLLTNKKATVGQAFTGTVYHNTLPDLEKAGALVNWGHIDDQAQHIVGDKTFTGTTNIATLNDSQLVMTDSFKNLVSTTDIPDGTTATTQADGDDSTKVATTAYVDSSSSTVSVKESNKAWIDQILGNDSSGTVGNMRLPFATYNAAAAAITTASANNPFVVRASNGLHVDASIVLQPFVYLDGDHKHATRFNVNSTGGNITVSSISATQDFNTGVSNIECLGITGINFDLYSIGGSGRQAYFWLNNIQNAAVLNFSARPYNSGLYSADGVYIENSTVGGSSVIDGGSLYSNNISGGYGSSVTIQSTNCYANAMCFQSIFFRLILNGTTSGLTTTVYLRSCKISTGSLTINGPYVALYSDELSLTGVTISYMGGATSAQVHLTSDAKNINYAPAVPGSWPAGLNSVSPALDYLANNKDYAWDGSVPFSTFYAQNNISTLTNAVTINLKGTGHTIDNKGSLYDNMQCVAFNSIDNVRTINIAQDVTLNCLPTLLRKVTLQSQSTSYVITNPFLSVPQLAYIGGICSLQCDSSISGVKFISLTGSNVFVLSFCNGNISNPHIFDLADTSTLQLALYNNCYLDATSISGTASTNLALIYLNDFDIFAYPYKSTFTNFSGNIYYVPISDNNQLRNVPSVTWDGSVLFSDFYALQNVSSLTSKLVIELVGTGHAIDNPGSSYTNVNCIYFDSGNIIKTINIADGVVFDAVPNLLSGVNLVSQSTSVVVTNPTNVNYWHIGLDSSFSTDSSVSGVKGISVTTGSFDILLANGSITTTGILYEDTIHIASPATVTITITNDTGIQSLEPKVIYGSSGSLIVNSSSAFTLPLAAAYTNYTGTLTNNYIDAANNIGYTPASPSSWPVGLNNVAPALDYLMSNKANDVPYTGSSFSFTAPVSGGISVTNSWFEKIGTNAHFSLPPSYGTGDSSTNYIYAANVIPVELVPIKDESHFIRLYIGSTYQIAVIIFGADRSVYIEDLQGGKFSPGTSTIGFDGCSYHWKVSS